LWRLARSITCRQSVSPARSSSTVEVTPETLYEAVALGMAAIRTDEWVTGIAQGLNAVKVRVMNVPVEYEVRLMDFTKWLERQIPSK
jgi:hypothetical protein